MQKKIKVTYLEYGQIQQKVIFLNNGWYNLPNDLQMNSIQEDHILRIDVVQESDTVIDTTI